MKLWIRSQNKEHLAIIKSLCCANRGDKSVVMGGAETTFDIVLGKYHTKERCLEIIDEIQYLLKNNGSKEDRMSQLLGGIENEFIVYEMPEN